MVFGEARGADRALTVAFGGADDRRERERFDREAGVADQGGAQRGGVGVDERGAERALAPRRSRARPAEPRGDR